MGYSFAAGTTDGPFASVFRQGMTESISWFEMLRNLLVSPTDEEIQCHAPKPILLPSGHVSNLSLDDNIVLNFVNKYSVTHCSNNVN